jgi:hypothetical protein
MRKSRIVLLFIFLALMICGIVIIVLNGKSLFQNTADIYYMDGCHEKYIDKKLVTPKCEEAPPFFDTPPAKSIGYNITFT